MMGESPICLDCNHYHKYESYKFTCDAFPDGIPEKIIDSEVIHREPYKGDHGIQFEPKS